jgi:CheY-like chemotaxis protein
VALSVLIVDDNAEFRAVARRLLIRQGFAVAGEAGSGAEGVSLARALAPEAVLLDVHLPDANGYSVARELARLPSPPRVLLTSTDRDADDEARSADGGVLSFVRKDQISRANLEDLFRGGIER